MNEATLLGEREAQTPMEAESDQLEPKTMEDVGSPNKNVGKWEAISATEKGFQDFPASEIPPSIEQNAANQEVAQVETGLFTIPRQELIERLKKCKSIGQYTAMFIANAVEDFAQLRADLSTKEKTEVLNLSTAAGLLEITGIGEKRANRIAEEFGLPTIDSAKSNPPERPEDAKSDDQTLAEAVAQDTGVQIDQIRQELGDNQLEAIHQTNMLAGDADLSGKIEHVSRLDEEDASWPTEMEPASRQSRLVEKLRFKPRVENLIRKDIKGFFEPTNTGETPKDFSLTEKPKPEAEEQVPLDDYQLTNEGQGPTLAKAPVGADFKLVKEPSDYDLKQPAPQRQEKITNLEDYSLVERVTWAIDTSSLSEGKKKWLKALARGVLVLATAATTASSVGSANQPSSEVPPVVRTTDVISGQDQEQIAPPAVEASTSVTSPEPKEPVQPQEPEVKRSWWQKLMNINKDRSEVSSYTKQIKDPEIKQTLETMAEYGVDRVLPIVEGDGQAPDLSPATVATPPAGEPLDVESTASPLPTETPAPEAATEDEAGTVRIEGSLWNHIARTLTEQGISNPTNAQIDAVKDLIRAMNKQLGLDIQFNQLPFENTFLEIKRPDQFEALKFNGVDQKYTGVFLTPEAVVEAATLALPETPENETDQEAHEILVEFTGPLDYDEATFEQTKTVLRAILPER